MDIDVPVCNRDIDKHNTRVKFEIWSHKRTFALIYTSGLDGGYYMYNGKNVYVCGLTVAQQMNFI